MSTKAKIKEAIINELNIEEFEAGLEAIIEVVEERPKLLENISKLLAKYVKLFTPMINELNIDVVNARVAVIENLETMGFTKDQAIKVVLGR